MKKVLILSLCLGIIFLTSCRPHKYNGNNQDLYTVAIHSVLWNLGHSYGADREMDSNIQIIDEDKYGRKIFTYREKYYAGAGLSFSALIISQSSTNEYVYYYEDINYIIKKQELYTQKIEAFTEDEIETLKLKNDWEKELDTNKCIKQRITSDKPRIPCDEKLVREKIVEYFNLNEVNIFMNYLASDTENNFIIYGVIDWSKEQKYFVVYLNIEDNIIREINFLTPTDVYNYQNELINFKIQNNWSNYGTDLCN